MSMLWRVIDYLGQSQVDPTAAAKYHYDYNDRYFKYISWIVIVSAIGYAAKTTNNVILWSIYLFSFLRLFAALIWLARSLPDKYGDNDVAPSKIRLAYRAFCRLAASIVVLWLGSPWGLTTVIESIAAARCAK